MVQKEKPQPRRSSRWAGSVRPARVGALLLIGIVMAAGLQAQTPRKHIRVILDTSKSMRKNDVPRLATLSTLLLHDLALPNVTRGETFEVLTFHPTNKWKRPSDPPPVETGPRLKVGRNRSEFVTALRNQAYDAAWTYYYPGLMQALQDLQAVSAPDDIRVIVVVTDGLPEPPTRQAELEKIRSEFLPAARSAGVRLYVLAFGPAAQSAGVGFFDQWVPQGIGEAFFDEDGSGLLENMARIFSRSFGYSVEVPAGRTYPQVRGLDLAGGQTPNRVAALMSWNRPEPPRFSLSPPPGGAINSREKPEGAEAGAGYSLWWVLSPQAGEYRLQSQASGASVAILRPSLLSMEVLAPQPDFQTYRTMALVDFPLNVRLRPQAGAKGDIGEVDLSFQAHGSRTRDPENPKVRYEWYEEKGAPPASDQGTVTAEGRVYSIFPRFRQPKDDQEYYLGNLELEAHRGEAKVASLVHPVEVYPFVAIAPTPREQDAQAPGSSNVLGRRDRGCADFRLDLREGRLPHPSQPRYLLHASLKSPLEGPLQGAAVTLDGLPLEVKGSPAEPAGVWYVGRKLSRDDLLGRHTACVQVGRPTHSDPAQSLPIEIVLTLQENPYHQFDVIEPFKLLARVARPGNLETLTNWLPWLLLLMMLLALWWSRYRPGLPEDLSLAAVSEGAGALRLGSPTWGPRLLGLRADRPVYADGDSRVLGWIRPEEEFLYLFRPASEVQVRGWTEGESVDFRGKGALLSATRVYRLRQGGRDWILKVEYR